MTFHSLDSSANSDSKLNAAASEGTGTDLGILALRNEALEAAYGRAAGQSGASVLSQHPDWQVPLICERYAKVHRGDTLGTSLAMVGGLSTAIAGAEVGSWLVSGVSFIKSPGVRVAFLVASAATFAYGLLRESQKAPQHYADSYNRCLAAFR